MVAVFIRGMKPHCMVTDRRGRAKGVEDDFSAYYGPRQLKPGLALAAGIEIQIGSLKEYCSGAID